MKNTTIALLPILLFILTTIGACTKTPLDGDDNNSSSNSSSTSGTTPTPPVANFSISPGSDIIADQTFVSFNSNATGTISSYFWHFGIGESSSTSTNPSYRFEREGYKTIKLDVSGPAGYDSKTLNVRVHAMNPNLHNYTHFSTQNEGHITGLRDLGLKIGRIKIYNNYSSSITIALYHPDSWRAGQYTDFAQWAISSGSTGLLNYDGQNINIGNDWGIQVTFSNGVKSAIRCLHYVSDYNNGMFTVKVSDIYNG